jgi:Ca2+-binding RTX toxin-like protein
VNRLAALLVFAGVLVLAPGASATTSVSVSGDTLTVTGGDEANTVRVSGFNEYFVYDTAGGVTAGAQCTQVDPTEAKCDYVPKIAASLGGGDDTWSSKSDSPLPTAQTIDAGPGNDNVVGASSGVPDTITGGEGDDHLDGGAGDDPIHGGPGNDTVLGGAGNDQVFGDEGDDTVRGDANDDAVDGGPGKDILNGDSTAASVLDGADRIAARDGEVDQVGCGFGADSVTADTADVIDSSECESVDRAGGGGGGGGSAKAVTLAATPTRLKISKLLSKGLSFKVTYADAGPTRVILFVPKKTAKRLKLGKKDTLLATDTDTVPQAGTYGAKLKVKAAMARKLRKLKHAFVATLAVSLTDSSGQLSTAKKSVILTL